MSRLTMVGGLWRGSLTVVLALNGRSFPSDPEWDDYLGLIRTWVALPEAEARNWRGLTFSDGGAPTGAQRRRLLDATGSRQSPNVALVTSSRLARGVGMALSWFMPAFRAFAPADFSRAILHIGIPGHELPALWQAVRDADAGIGLEVIAAIEPGVRAVLGRTGSW